LTPEQSTPSPNGQTFRFFAVFQKYVDIHAEHLSCPERSLYIAYLRFADGKTGIAYPGGDRLGKLIGQSGKNHIPSIRAKLIYRGLIEIVDGGGGRSVTCAIRVLMPPDQPILNMETSPRR
jgi:hypothetical protein